MLTEDAFSSGHLVMSHIVSCKCSNVETNLSCVNLSSFRTSEFRTSLGASSLLGLGIVLALKFSYVQYKG